MIAVISGDVSSIKLNTITKLFQTNDAVLYIGPTDNDSKVFGTKFYSGIPGNIGVSNNQENIIEIVLLSNDRTKRDVCLINKLNSKLTKEYIEKVYSSIIKDWVTAGASEYYIWNNS